MSDDATPDYAALSGPGLLNELGTDARKWAAAFNRCAVDLGYTPMPEGWVNSWFANAIMAAYDASEKAVREHQLVCRDIACRVPGYHVRSDACGRRP